MSVLGISSYGMIFEGDAEYGAHLVWPQAVVTLAKFVKETDEALIPATDNENGHCCFREDSFDPVSRIRRGRFYHWGGNTGTWQVLQSSIIPIPGGHNTNGLISISLRGYRSYKPSTAKDGFQNLVILGSSGAFSTWSIVAVETISTGEELVTLRSRQSLGALPDIYWAKVPVEHRHKVEETIGKLADDYRRAVPESVIDRAREAATAILSTYLQSREMDAASGKDLGDLVKTLAKHARPHEERILACAAEIAQRLHSRSKNATKEQFDNLRPIREQELNWLCNVLV